MSRISSRATFFYKRITPIFWFGFLALFIAVPLVVGSSTGRYPPPPFFIVPVVMAVIGYFFMKKLIFDLVDEVWDAGDALVVKNKDQEDRVALSNIMNVSYSPFMNPPRVSLRLRRPCAFGTEVAFCAPLRFIPFAGNPIVDELIRRIDATRKV